MKRMTVMIMAALLCLCLAACGKAPEQSTQEPHTEATNTEATEEKRQSGSPAHSGNTAGQQEELVQQSVELIGPWHLDSDWYSTIGWNRQRSGSSKSCHSEPFELFAW